MAYIKNKRESRPAPGARTAISCGTRIFVARTLCLIGFAALQAGCLQTEYQRPTAPVAASWPAENPAEGTRIAARTDWRAFFPDPRLQALIAAALEHNRDLRIAVARVEEARAQYNITRAERLPTINSTSSRNATLTPGDLGGTNASISGQRYDIAVTAISYEVDFWGRVSGMAESGRASYLATEDAQRAARLSLISDVANGYFTLLEMNERAELTRSALALREKALELVTHGREAGFASNLDYLQAESALQSARAEAAMLDRERAAATNNLQLLVGHAPDALPPGRTLASQGVVADLAAGLPSEVLLARPDVLAAEQRLIAAHANIGSARAAFLPRILLTASLGIASRALSTLFAPGNNTWAFQPAITTPLFDGGRNEGNLDLAKAREVIAVADYEKTIQQAFREVADLLATRAALAEQRKATEANVVAMEERVKTMLALYKGGQSSYLEVLDAQRDQFSAQQAAVQVRRAQLTAAAQLYKALGGGE
jgi:multidrug efflux system outer membrane protein